MARYITHGLKLTSADSITTSSLEYLFWRTFSRPRFVVLGKVHKRNRLGYFVYGLTPHCKNFFNICMKIIHSKRRPLYGNEERLEKAQQLSENKSFKMTIDHIPRIMRDFLYKEIKLADKQVKKLNFSSKEKILALKFLHQSPKSYTFLQKLFVLPTKQTIDMFTEEFSLAPGLEPHILGQVAECVKNWPAKKRACTIIFSEFSLMPHLSYVEAEDYIHGLVDYGRGRRKKIPCDRSLVFMVRGIQNVWSQMIGYYFCWRHTPSSTLKTILEEVVEGVTQAGLNPLAIICGQKFQRRLNKIKGGLPNDGHTISIKGRKLNIIYNPPHLIKGICDLLRANNLSHPRKRAQWSDIVYVFNLLCQRKNNRLKSQNEHPTESQKHKAKDCTQVPNEDVGVKLLYKSRFGKCKSGTVVFPTMKNKSDAVIFFERLFDSINGCSSDADHPRNLAGVPEDDTLNINRRVSFWREAITILEQCHLFESSDKDTKKSVPTIANWIITLRSLIHVCCELKKIGVTSLDPRNLNQVPLDNCFSKIRALNPWPDIDMPLITPYYFDCSFKMFFLVNNYPHPPSSDCEDSNDILSVKLVKRARTAASWRL